MKFVQKLLFPLFSALLLSALVTELHFRLYADQYFALFLLVAIAILLVSLANVPVHAALSGLKVSRARPPRQQKPRHEQRRERAPSRSQQRPNNAAPAAAEVDRETGTVKWFNRNKGYGFIARDNGEEIFVHFKSIRGGGRRNLRDGQTVSFIVSGHDKGLQADQVIALDEPDEA